MQPTIYVALGAVVAALITGTIAFIALIISKEQKTSEFRQQWIDALREDLSEFAGACGHLLSLWVYIKDSATSSAHYEQMQEKLIENNREELFKIVSLRVKILLRINPNEHKELVSKVEAAFDLVKDKIPSTVSEGRPAIDNLVSEGQRVLKSEWSRVKKGEAGYRTSKICAIIVIALLFILTAKFSLSDEFISKLSSTELHAAPPIANKEKVNSPKIQPETQNILPQASTPATQASSSKSK